jgi:hypothetical protein
MNENIELQVQIIIGLVALAGLGAGAYKIWGGFKIAVKNAVDEQFKDLSQTLTDIDDKLAKVDKETTKNFLVRCLADVERGDSLSETELERFSEQYDHYVKDLRQNTYIKDKVRKLKSEGKL